MREKERRKKRKRKEQRKWLRKERDREREVSSLQNRDRFAGSETTDVCNAINRQNLTAFMSAEQRNEQRIRQEHVRKEKNE